MVEDSPAARTPISDELRAQIRALLAAFPQGLPASRTVLSHHAKINTIHLDQAMFLLALIMCRIPLVRTQDHKLNMELDLQSLFVHL
jgi:hypothetical protein